MACLSMFFDVGAEVALLDTLYPMWREIKWPLIKEYGCSGYPRASLPRPWHLARIPRRFARYGLPYDAVKSALERIYPPPDLILVGSGMTYWYPGVISCVRMVRKLWPYTPIVVGGIYATLCHEHALSWLDADLVIKGPLEEIENWNALWRLLGIEPPPIPSFKLHSFFYPAPSFSVIMGSRGCPYRCEYCASGVLFPDFFQRDLEEVWSEFEFEVKRGVRDFAFYDDALLYRPEQWFIPFLKRVVDNNIRVRFHTPNGLHVRYLTPEVCALMKRAGFKTLRLGLETTHFKSRLDSKLTKEEWDRGISVLKSTGFSSMDIGVYILFGLPLQGKEEIKNSIEFVKSYGLRPHLAYYSPIPGSKLFSVAKDCSFFDLSDPICHNNALWPCYPGGFSWEERSRWKEIISRSS